jgi:hypothetical protein
LNRRGDEVDATRFQAEPEVNSAEHICQIDNAGPACLTQSCEEKPLPHLLPLRLAHDFGQIPVHFKSPAKVMAKLTAGAVGDACEQEADRVSAQVMRMLEPQLQPTCASGGGSPKCRSEQTSYEHLQPGHAHDSGEVTASPLVHEVQSAACDAESGGALLGHGQIEFEAEALTRRVLSHTFPLISPIAHRQD